MSEEPVILVHRRGDTLIPHGPMDADAIRQFDAGKPLRVELRQRRNPNELRLYWAMIALIRENLPNPAPSPQVLHDAIKVMMGYTITVHTLRGDVTIPGSIAFGAMDQPEWRLFLEDFKQLVRTRIIPGMSSAAFEKAASEMMGDPFPEREAAPESDNPFEADSFEETPTERLDEILDGDRIPEEAAPAEEPRPKRHRRTKAEMEAARSAVASPDSLDSATNASGDSAEKISSQPQPDEPLQSGEPSALDDDSDAEGLEDVQTDLEDGDLGESSPPTSDALPEPEPEPAVFDDEPDAFDIAADSIRDAGHWLAIKQALRTLGNHADWTNAEMSRRTSIQHHAFDRWAELSSQGDDFTQPHEDMTLFRFWLSYADDIDEKMIVDRYTLSFRQQWFIALPGVKIIPGKPIGKEDVLAWVGAAKTRVGG